MQKPPSAAEVEEAIRIAELVGVGKMIGFDEEQVIAALLWEVKQLRQAMSQVAKLSGFSDVPKKGRPITGPIQVYEDKFPRS